MKITENKLTVTDDRLQYKHGGVCKKVMAEIDGTKVMVKLPYNWDFDVAAERIAYTFGKKLGFHVNEVHIAKLGKQLFKDNKKFEFVSIHTWEDGFKTIGHEPKQKRNRKYDGMKLAMQIFDNVMYNTDRHEYNYGVCDGYLYFIDHGHCRFYEGFCNEMFSAEFLATLKIVNEVNNPFTRIVKRFLALTDEDIKKLWNGVPKKLREKGEDTFAMRVKHFQNYIAEKVR